MREGIYWRGSNRGRRRQQEYNPNESFVLPSGRQARGTTAKVLVLFLILCFVTWTLTRFRTPLPISTKSLPHQAPTRAVVLELFRYRYPQARNRSFTALAPVHRRGRGLLEDSETTASTSQEIFDEEEQEEQPFAERGVDDNLILEFDSWKKRKGCHNDHESKACPQEASSSTRAAQAQWPLLGGVRASDVEIESFFVKVALGYGTRMHEYFMSIDTGSGTTWVNCEGRGPVALLGPNGLFHPRSDSFLNCKDDQKLCKDFQEGDKHPCDRKHRFRCLFDHEYGDSTAVQGSIIVGDVSLDLSDGSRSQTSIAFGCAERVKDENTVDGVQETISTDGLLGLGPHPAGWLHQLNFLGLISEYVVAVCLQPALGHIIRRPGPSLLEHAGFISLGDLFTTQAASTSWTATIPPESTEPEENDEMYSARLVGIKYREDVLFLKAGVQMGFDTGSDLTYLHPAIFHLVVEILDLDARRMGYIKTRDRGYRVGKDQRKCWQAKSGRESSVRDFGDLTMMFSSLADDGTTSDLVIKPEYYITSWVRMRLTESPWELMHDVTFFIQCLHECISR